LAGGSALGRGQGWTKGSEKSQGGAGGPGGKITKTNNLLVGEHMSFTSDTLGACEYLLRKAEQKQFIVEGSSSEKSRQLTKRAKFYKNTHRAMRERHAVIARMLQRGGWSQDDIAAEVGVSKSLIGHVAARLRKEGRL
jgi:hypothetical protein